MPPSIDDVLKSFTSELDNLRKQGIQISQKYREAKDIVTHHILACKISGKPVDLAILSSIPKPDKYIKDIGTIEKNIITLQREYKNNLEKLK